MSVSSLTLCSGDEMIPVMATFSAVDGTLLAYHVLGRGAPVICLPGGPMQDPVYLGDLGGLPRWFQVIKLDLRGTGESQTPAETGSYRCDRLVEDVEALREHLGLDRIDLLGHSAGTNLAVSYAIQYPARIDKLLLINPSTLAVGLIATSQMRREVVHRRVGEPWFASASEAFERIAADEAGDDDWEAIAPLTYGRWDAAARAHHEQQDSQRNDEAAKVFSAEGAYDPETTRRALATLRAPVLLVAGELDVAAPPRIVMEFAALFANATLVTEPGGGHFPWLDDPSWFTATLATFLRGDAAVPLRSN